MYNVHKVHIISEIELGLNPSYTLHRFLLYGLD